MIFEMMLVPYWLWLHACWNLPLYIATGRLLDD